MQTLFQLTTVAILNELDRDSLEKLVQASHYVYVTKDRCCCSSIDRAVASRKQELRDYYGEDPKLGELLMQELDENPHKGMDVASLDPRYPLTTVYLLLKQGRNCERLIMCTNNTELMRMQCHKYRRCGSYGTHSWPVNHIRLLQCKVDGTDDDVVELAIAEFCLESD